MTTKPGATLREVRRGDELHELQLLDSAGCIVILHAHGVHDEKLRTRERALQLLTEVLPR